MKKSAELRLSLKSLIVSALQDWDSDASWEVIHVLRTRAELETVQLIQKLFRSRNWRKRALAVNIICQLQIRSSDGSPNQDYAVETSHEILLAALEDSHQQVAEAALFGLGHRKTAKAIPTMVAYAKHFSKDIRYAVAFALGGNDDEASIAALLSLAGDIDDDVRDWAIFGLGSLCTADTPEVRECLWCNTRDENEDVRGEALAGLACRHDERTIPLLMQALVGDEVRVYALEAAETMADPHLYSPLKALWDEYASSRDCNQYWFSVLDSALQACAPAEMKTDNRDF